MVISFSVIHLSLFKQRGLEENGLRSAIRLHRVDGFFKSLDQRDKRIDIQEGEPSIVVCWRRWLKVLKSRIKLAYPCRTSVTRFCDRIYLV
ncbi:hypothetical protein AVEN_259867-1 [Araneus ventricosus]|uniref:Uncharacterized protein n=1 Tax=Araneus ventricosus TaxID=182803 RepID=A0A4Y2DR07_ARAVE|nr:hypothetical protein AVEN_259867-1 [Araneus ventricosus]